MNRKVTEARLVHLQRHWRFSGRDSPFSNRSAITRSANACALARAWRFALAIGEHTGQCGHFRDPAPVLFAFGFELEYSRLQQRSFSLHPRHKINEPD